jgi:hypothetical protein
VLTETGLNSKTKEGKKLRNTVDNLIKKVKSSKEYKSEENHPFDKETMDYIMKDTGEFIAYALTNPNFQVWLNNIEFSKKESFFVKLINIIKKWITGNTNVPENIVAQITDAVTKYVEKNDYTLFRKRNLESLERGNGQINEQIRMIRNNVNGMSGLIDMRDTINSLLDIVNNDLFASDLNAFDIQKLLENTLDRAQWARYKEAEENVDIRDTSYTDFVIATLNNPENKDMLDSLKQLQKNLNNQD